MKNLFRYLAVMICLVSAQSFGQANPSPGTSCSSSANSCSLTTTAGQAITVWAVNFNAGGTSLTIDGNPVSAIPGYPRPWESGAATSTMWIFPNATAGTHAIATTNLGGDHFPTVMAFSTSGTSTVIPMDTHNFSNGGGTPATCAAVTTTHPSDLIVSFASWISGDVTVATSTQAMTQFIFSGGNAAAYGVVPSAGSASVSWSSTAGDVYTCDTIAIRPEPAVEPTVASIVVAPSSPTIFSNAKKQMSATVTYSDGTVVDVTNTATWASATPATATISAFGLVTAVAPGTTNITATVGGVTSSADVLTVTPYIPQHWYVRNDGGTRYDATLLPSGQCDGLHDAAYPGTGTNQACAFNDVRYYYSDLDNGCFGGACWAWVGNGGDIYTIEGGPWRIGNTNPNVGDWSGGLRGENRASGMPNPPSGTSAAHTVIRGGNFASCTAQSARTQLYGGYGVSTILSTAGSSYIDVSCLDMTDHSACGLSGQVNLCAKDPPTTSDYAATGIGVNNTSTHLTFTDMRLHGLAVEGISGATGDDVTFTDIQIIGNASAGWNADDGSGTTGVGHSLMQDFEIAWSGCSEEYPIVDTLPYWDCTDQESQGYGDGFGTTTIPSNPPGWQATFTRGVVYNNTQDGLDALHLTGAGSSMTITRTLDYGNMGQQVKIGGAAGTLVNNVIYGNCHAMSNAIPGTPPTTAVFTAGHQAAIPITGSATFGSNTVTGIASTAGISVGDYIYGDGDMFAPFGQLNKIIAVGANSLTISSNGSNPNLSGIALFDTESPILTGVTVVSGTPTVGQPIDGPDWRAPGLIVSITGSTMLISSGFTGGALTGGTYETSWHSLLSQFCRAGNVAVVGTIADDALLVEDFNTIFSNNGIATEIDCNGACTTRAPTEYQNNIVVGFFNPDTTDLPTPIFTDTINPFSSPGSINSNNITYGWKSNWECPATGFNEVNAKCGSPLLTDMTYPAYGYGNTTPTSGTSGAGNWGTPIAGVTTDFSGANRPGSSPSAGAIQFNGVAPTLTTVTVNPAATSVGSTTTAVGSCMYSDGVTTTPCSGTWTDTAGHSSINSSTGVITGVSAGTDTITYTVSGVLGTNTVTVSAVPSFKFVQGASFLGRTN